MLSSHGQSHKTRRPCKAKIIKAGVLSVHKNHPNSENEKRSYLNKVVGSSKIVKKTRKRNESLHPLDMLFALGICLLLSKNADK